MNTETTNLFDYGGRAMRTPRIWCRCIVAALAACGSLAMDSATASAGKAKFNKVLDFDDAAPDFGKLPGVDDRTHALADYDDADVLVVVFTCNRCPVARGYEERMIAFSRQYADRNVRVVAICASRNPADRLDKMKVRSQERQFPFPYLSDESQRSARAYGATATPQFFVLDKRRKVAYMGAFDDNATDPEKVEKHYLIDAVEAVLQGKTPRVRESLPKGCEIQFD